MKHEPLKALQPRQSGVKLMQSHSPAVLAGIFDQRDLRPPTYDMDAAARIAYESFVRELGLKIGEKVSDASGVHRIGSWDSLKTFQKARWRTLAQDVIDAATGVQRKQLDLTSTPDVKGSPDGKAKPGGGSHEQDIQVRRRQRPRRRAARHTSRHASTSAARRVDSKRS